MEQVVVNSQKRKEVLILAIRALLNDQTPVGFIDEVVMGGHTFRFMAFPLQPGMWVICQEILTGD